MDAADCVAAVGGGWAVWRHGYLGRVTQDIDIVPPAPKIDEFLRVAGVSGFEVEVIRQYLLSVHPDYVTRFNQLVTRAAEEDDR